MGELVRTLRQENAVKDITEVEQHLGGAGRKKLITIQIVRCQDLVVKYGQVATVSPFFYYQFYDKDEKYSPTMVGRSPVFDDMQSYEVMLDAKLVNYLQRESLEEIFFDDNAPIAGLDRGAQASGEQSDDMIGTASIPLADLLRGASIQDRFPLRKTTRQATESLGTVEIKISIMDLDQLSTGTSISKVA